MGSINADARDAARPLHCFPIIAVSVYVRLLPPPVPPPLPTPTPAGERDIAESRCYLCPARERGRHLAAVIFRPNEIEGSPRNREREAAGCGGGAGEGNNGSETREVCNCAAGCLYRGRCSRFTRRTILKNCQTNGGSTSLASPLSLVQTHYSPLPATISRRRLVLFSL